LSKEIIRIGIIGAGFARTTQIPGFVACEGARVVGLASGHLKNAERVAQAYDIEQATDDWLEVVERDDIDLISIVTPPSLHMEMTLAALASGKAVLCEKPTAMNANEADAMRRGAREHNQLALIDHELRFLEGRRRLREMIRRGEIGRVRHAKYLFRSDSRADASRAWNWWSDETQGGGALGAIGSHVVDSFRWLLSTEVSEVSCQLATHVRERADKEGRMRRVTADDEANLLLRFQDSELIRAATALVSISMVEQGQPEHRMEVFGTEGALAVEDKGALWRSETGAGRWTRVESEAGGEVAEGMQDSGWSRGFTTFARAIVAALREGRKSVEDAATFEDGYRTQLVLDGARRSSQSGVVQNIEN
jgi:predicted dehydrogenase